MTNPLNECATWLSCFGVSTTSAIVPKILHRYGFSAANLAELQEEELRSLGALLECDWKKFSPAIQALRLRINELMARLQIDWQNSVIAAWASQEGVALSRMEEAHLQKLLERLQSLVDELEVELLSDEELKTCCSMVEAMTKERNFSDWSLITENLHPRHLEQVRSALGEQVLQTLERGEAIELYQWLIATPNQQLPAPPFMLRSWQTVEDRKFFDKLRSEAQATLNYLQEKSSLPAASAKYDALQQDVKQLKRLFELEVG